MKLYRTYKFRLLPTRRQHSRLEAALAHTRDLYNAALQERVDVYRKTGKSVTRFQQMRGLAELRADKEWAEYASAMQRWPLVKVDNAFQAFFRRLKAGDKPGYPRFKRADSFKSFGFSDKSGGWSIARERLYMKGIGAIRVHFHRALPADPTNCIVRRDAKGWFVLLVCLVDVEMMTPTGENIGIDVGITNFAALSTGELVPNPKHRARLHRELRRRMRQLSRCRKGSKGGRKKKLCVERIGAKERRIRRAHMHQLAARIVRQNDLIAVEDLNFRALARGIFSRESQDAGWATFIELLAEKAAKAGRTLVKVDARGTSQTCPECGTVAFKALSERVHSCQCGCTGDRDVIAAREILRRAGKGPGTHNVARWGERAAGNTTLTCQGRDLPNAARSH